MVLDDYLPNILSLVYENTIYWWKVQTAEEYKKVFFQIIFDLSIRRLILRHAWESIFEEFLNIPNCQSMPKWDKAVQELEKALKSAVEIDEFAWKKGLERFNLFLSVN